MSTPKVGVILRVYEKDQAKVAVVVQSTLERLALLRTCGFHHIVVMVATDKDCGSSAEALRKQLTWDDVQVLDVRGHENTDLLNAGIQYLSGQSIQIALIVSGKAIKDGVAVIKAAVPKAQQQFLQNHDVIAVGLTVNKELEPHVVKGQFQNTMCFWRIDYVRQHEFTSKDGVEEIAVLAQGARGSRKTVVIRHGPIELEISASREARHAQVVDTKSARIAAAIAAANSSESALMGMVMTEIQL